jgi:general secretion pathway protein G
MTGTSRRAIRAFTLVELLVVMAIISTLLTIAVPRYLHSVDRSKEVALKQTLAVTREAIDKYHGDTGAYPESLQELVAKRYLRRLPYDPLAESEGSWVLVARPDAAKREEVYDLRSAMQGRASDGTAYGEW